MLSEASHTKPFDRSTSANGPEAADAGISLLGDSAAAFVAERQFRQTAPPQAADTVRLTAEARTLLSAADLYHHHFPGTAPDHTLQLKAAAAESHLGRFSDARRRLRPIIEQDPTTALAERAARLILDTYITEKDWRGLRATAIEFADGPGLSSPAFRSRLDEVLAQTAAVR